MLFQKTLKFYRRDKYESILTDIHEVIEWWKQYFDEQLNAIESVGNEGQDDDENDYVSTAGDRNQPGITLSLIKDAD